MSVSIRHRYHHGNVIINQSKVVIGSALTGVNIPASLKSGEYCYRPFGGVIDDDSVMRSATRVKLMNITGFWWDDSGLGDCYDIPLGHATKGYFLDGSYYVAIKDDRPIHWEVNQPRMNYRTNNVVNMGKPIKTSL